MEGFKGGYQMIIAYSIMKQLKNQLDLRCTWVKGRSAKTPGEIWPIKSYLKDCFYDNMVISADTPYKVMKH